jgi:DNA-binding IclR family transcriptional regulator
VGSPSVERAIQILDFLTTHPGRGFSLSELSRRLDISKATAHGVLATLAERALVTRNPDTAEFRLGPALVAMGAVAERGMPALTQARAEAERLAEEFEAECVVVIAAGEELLLAARAGVPGPGSITSHEGQRHPHAPPLGSVVVAWTPDEEVEAWLDRLDPAFTDAERAHYRAAVTRIRRQGYAVGVRVERLADLSEIYADAELHSPEGRRRVGRAMAALAHDHSYLPTDDDEIAADAEIGSVAAPVFDSDGALLFAIALMPDGRHGSDIPVLSRAVLRAAGRVMDAIGGRRPVLQTRGDDDAHRPEG